MKKKKNRALDTNQIVIEMGALHAFSSLHLFIILKAMKAMRDLILRRLLATR